MTPQYKFHPIIARTYSQVHRWLQQQRDANGYKEINRAAAVGMLNELTFLSTAAQFNLFFPAHFFKVAKTLNEIIGYDTLESWLNNNPRLCILDVGCGAGTATVAVIDAILNILDSGWTPPHEIELYTIGIDINHYAIVLYQQMMSKLKNHLTRYNFKLTHDYINEGIPGATISVIENLETKLKDDWKQPNIARALITQVNLVSPLSRIHNNRIQNRNTLENLLGTELFRQSPKPSEFGREEAIAYEQLFKQSHIDNLHVLTIGTTNTEENGYLLENRVYEMVTAISKIFGGENYNHIITESHANRSIVDYSNPVDCFWRDNGVTNYSSDFVYGINYISNNELHADKDWQAIIDTSNLKLAWARARANLMDSFFDEIEVRLFEQDLDTNLFRIQEQLINYKNNIIPDGERISFRQPKNQSHTRPRGLTRLEEEIMSVAIIQKLGNRISNENSYGYRIKGEHNSQSTEQLYENWWTAYKKYVDDTRSVAEKSAKNAIVLQVDIERFYETIIQQQLIDLASKNLQTDSQRIKWLLKQLINNRLDEHKMGLGINQGSIGSGFFANLYLSPIDQLFTGGNSWNLRFFRYVDDMTFIIPNPEDEEEILKVLQDKLSEPTIGLRLNIEKYRRFENVAEFIKKTKPDDLLDNLSKRYRGIIESLYILNRELRSALIGANRRNGDDWWEIIEQYRLCLAQIGLYISTIDLSRKVYSYLFSEEKRRKQLDNRSELRIPALPSSHDLDDLARWARKFRRENQGWFLELNNIRTALIEIFTDIYENSTYELEKSDYRRLHFVTNRLGLLGLHPIVQGIVSLLSEQPWVFGDPANLINNLAINGLYDALVKLLHQYTDDDSIASEYIRALILRSMRHIPELSANLSNLIVEYAVSHSASISERLMATETMLYRRYHYQNQLENHHIDALKFAMRRTEITNQRLIKNYMLLLDGNIPSKYSQIENRNHLLSSTRNYISSSPEQDLFEYYEPNILREEFYSGIRTPSEDNTNGNSP